MKKWRRQMEELVALASPSWAGEAEVVRVYLAERRTPARDVVWLRAQAWKETRLLRVLSPEQEAELAANGWVSQHPEGASRQKFAEEINHFELISGLIAELTGARVELHDLAELPEEARLQAVRAPHRAGTKFERTVVNFTEGGGGAIYRELGRLDGGPFERRMAEVFREIHDDEVFHGPAEIHRIAGLAQDERDWQQAAEIVAKISRQRLRMRNEMFSFPLDESRLEEIAAGRIEPWPMPIAL